MTIAAEKALEILLELIRKPESPANDIPRIWNEVLGVYNAAFAPPVEEPKKKKRRRPANPNIGWPQGVSRDEYRTWKEMQIAKGQSENLNPQHYKKLRESGEIVAVAKTAAKKEAPKVVAATAPAPKAAAPKAAAPKVDAPKTAAPKAIAPKAVAPKKPGK
jgi:hypothetical protein